MRHAAARSLAWLGLCILAGCAGPDPDGKRQASGLPPLHDPFHREPQRIEVRLVALPGRATRLNTWFSLKRDCELQDYVRVQVAFAPRHGTVTIERGSFRPSYPRDTYRAACDADPHDGVAAVYHPEPGYTGPDSLTLDIETPSGRAWTTDFAITVR